MYVIVPELHYTLTPRIEVDKAPPPDDSIPGCGSPLGGNVFNGGGAMEAINIIPMAMAISARKFGSLSLIFFSVSSFVDGLIMVLI